MRTGATATSVVPEVFQLLAAQPALRDESMGSWIQRVCGDHQYSMPALIRIVGYAPVLRDWDLPIPYEVRQRIRSMAPVGTDHERQQLSLLAAACIHMHPAQMLWHARRQPKYRWCSKCFRADAVPYLRWFWRLSALSWCPRHRLTLAEACPACKAPLTLHTSRLVAIGSHGRATTLAECDQCGCRLSSARQKGLLPSECRVSSVQTVIVKLGEAHQFIDEAYAEQARDSLVSLLPPVSKACKRQAPAVRSVLRDAQLARPLACPVKRDELSIWTQVRYEALWMRSLQCR